MGKFVEWHADFSVENSLIDEQHKGLFELVNQMWDSRKDGEKKKRASFKKIVEALRAHCNYEERILAKNGCPSLKEHRHEHLNLIKQIEEILDSCDKDCKKSWFKMMGFLMHELLAHHLVGTDQKCRKYLRS